MINGQFIYTFGMKHVNDFHSVELAEIKAQCWGRDADIKGIFFHQTGKHYSPETVCAVTVVVVDLHICSGMQ